MQDARVAVVGGGIAGLVAAATLARRGLSPVLFEATPELGGRAQTRVVEGFHLNQGPHALYARGAFSAALAELGLSVAGERLSLTDAVAVWGEAAHPLPTRLAAGRDAPPLSPADAICLAETFARIGSGDYGGSGRPLRAFTEPLPAAVRTVIEAFVRLSSYGHAPEEMDCKAALDQLRLSFGGVIYVHGGWGTLIASLADAATEAGAVLLTEQRVTTVRRDGQAWRVQVAGRAADGFDAVVLAVSPSAAHELIERSADLATTVDAVQPLRVVGLDLALAPGAEGVGFALGMDTPTYMSLHSAVADLAPSGAALLHVAHYLGPGENPTAAHLQELERLTDRLWPGWRERLVHKQRLVGLAVVHDYPRWRTGGRRTPVIVADAPGVFLAGDWIGDEGMLSDAAAASGLSAARAAATFVKSARKRPQ